MTIESGSLLNKRYRIVEVLEQGGMAAVYRAIDENLGVEVAVKENLFTTIEYARQFRLEATILASLRHPNLPRVSDHFVIEQQGQYLVMDYIEGEDLRQRLDRLGPLSEQEVIIIGVAISDAMAYMHSRSPMVLHRDIKPGNVRITPDGHIFLVDFGLAKIVQGREITDSGARAMTPGYSPPEQYGNARTDQRSDIYSLGATLYSALTDELPEDGLARAVDQSALTPVTKWAPLVSRQLAGVVEKCLEVRPENRYQSAEDLRADLLNARTMSDRSSPFELVLPPPPITLESSLPKMDSTGIPPKADGTALEQEAKERFQKIKPRFWVLIFFALTLAVIVGAVLFIPDLLSRSPGIVISSATPTRMISVDVEPGITELITENDAILVDTKQPIVATSNLQPPALSTGTRLPTATTTQAPAATLTGGGLSQILFASDRSGAPEIYLINIYESQVIRLTNITEGACQPDWSPNGQQIIFVSPCPKDQVSYPGSSMFIMNTDGSNLVPLPSVPGGDYDPSWSPDGKHVAFTSLRDGAIPKVFIMRLDDYYVIPLAEEGDRTISQPAWSPDGKSIAYVGSDNRVWAMDIATGESHALTIGGGDYESSEPTWSPDGSTVVFVRRRVGDSTATNWMVAVPYSTEGTLATDVPNAKLISKVSYSPDGYWLAFKSWAEGNHDIYIMRPSGVDKQVVVSDEAYDFDPVWRPYLQQP